MNTRRQGWMSALFTLLKGFAMKADLTRDTFDPLKYFTRVLMQQGRVQVDADWNEQVSMLLHYVRTLAADLIGEAGGPEHNCGFILSINSEFASDFRIGPGRYYVDGLLCELETSSMPITQPAGFTHNEIYIPALILDGIPFSKPQTGEPAQYVEIFTNNTAPVIARITDADLLNHKLTLDKDVSTVLGAQSPQLRRVVTYFTQPDFPLPAQQTLGTNKSYAVYLDVWERLITYIEDDAIREVALNGPDTAARAKLIWQVKLLEGTPGNAYDNPCDHFVPKDSSILEYIRLENRGRLRAKAKQDAQATDPCITPPHSQYRGVENQLYRVEIHHGGTAWSGEGEVPASVATFKWSRENGAVVYAVQNVATDSAGSTTTVTVESFGRDDRFSLVEGDWVELVSDDTVLLNVAPPLLQVQEIDRAGMTVILNGVADTNYSYAPGKQPLLRRWDHKEGDPTEGGLRLAGDGAAYLLENTDDQWLELEDGVKVQFLPRTPDNPYVYQTGDYWLIPARVATGDVEWPTVVDSASGETIPAALMPDGVEHHYAPIAILNVSSYGAINIAPCQKIFSALANRPLYDYAFASAGIGAANLAVTDAAPAAPAAPTARVTTSKKKVTKKATRSSS
jgi:hypothetical protein